jgi:aspartate kinase/aspartokinase/homoserine dehydrogenase 1
VKSVVKFGGSNLKSKDDISRLVTVVKNYGEPIIIVVSAFYGVTNYLIESLAKARNDESVAKKVSEYLFSLKHESVLNNITDKEVLSTVLNSIKELLVEIEKYFQGIALTGDASKALEDNILSYGERLSAVFLQGVLLSEGLHSEVALPEDIGLYTDGDFGNASINFARSTEPVRKALSDNKIYIVPGFYGISEEGIITLLGRGGTDYSAAALARCIGASSLDIWKDVDGFRSADPKLVKESEGIKYLNYSEAAELAYFGAKILHPRTVEPLLDPKIPIRIFNICGELDVNNPLSVINANEVINKGVVKSVTYSDEFGVLKLKGAGVGVKPGILAKVTTALHHAGINISSVITSQISINILLSKEDLRQAYAVVSAIELSAVGELLLIDNISVIAAVGSGLVDNYGIAARIFSSLAGCGINVFMSCSGASPVVSYFLVKSEDRTNAVNAVHAEFFKK